MDVPVNIFKIVVTRFRVRMPGHEGEKLRQLGRFWTSKGSTKNGQLSSSDLLSHSEQIVTAFLTSASVYIRDIVSCFSVFGERGLNWNSRWARVTKRVTMYTTTA
ncbi:hypothetical protein BCON_0087g00070 [Botryotinia convoluta]|uniref:Uncharacterized protein n=1 Tax=Botryotinia convoluta TaxID=54673 RepID=A0A4Z1I4Z3_9HELO|nr:hypothetical protein BCON_0087g00070 [Botryotinia convoluta]